MFHVQRIPVALGQVAEEKDQMKLTYRTSEENGSRWLIPTNSINRFQSLWAHLEQRIHCRVLSKCFWVKREDIFKDTACMVYEIISLNLF